MPRTLTLLIQPYGGAVIDTHTKVFFLNETATDITRALIDGQDESQATEFIAATYDISREQAMFDIKEFLHDSEIGHLFTHTNPDSWNISGWEKTTSIVEADICLTDRCNLECTYCYAEAGKSRNGDLTPEQWQEAIRALVRLGMRKATVAGGEPTLSRAFFPVLQMLAEADVAIQLFTNGLLLKTNIVERLKEIHLNFVQVSLDSVQAECHDRYRSQSHALALHAIKLLTKEGIPVVIGANIFPDTIGEVTALATLADSLGATLRCNPIEARGRGSQFDANETVVNESFTASVAKAVEEASSQRPHVFADQEVRQTIKTTDRICPFSKGCVAVTASAEIRPCSQTDTFFMSVAPWAIDPKKAWEYDQTIEEHIAFKTIAQIKPEVCPTHETCADCNKYSICAGCLLAGYTCNERR